MAQFAGFDLKQVGEWDENGEKNTISIDVAALLTPCQEKFVEDNIENLELVPLNS